MFLFNSVSDPKTIIEIGVNEGRTAAAALRNLPTLERYIGVDVLPGYRFDKRVQRNEVPARPGHYAIHDPRFQLMLRKRGSLDLAPQSLPQADAIFIDGDHGERAVMRDYMLARFVVRPAGIIVFHDDHDRDDVDVRKVLDKLFDQGEMIFHVAGTWLAYQRIADA